MSQLASTECEIRFKRTKEKDTYNHEAFDNRGDRIDYGVFPYDHSRDLPPEVAKKAFNYIRILARSYPFQLRYAMSLPLWERFAEEWCDTGDETKALKAI